MPLPTISQERQPMVCLLLGLLLVAVGLLLGLDGAASISATILGLLISVFGVILFVLQLQERPKKSTATRLSPEFISAGGTTQMPAHQVEQERAPVQPAAE
jgi:uncharacterized membrane protein HdeD (DUF308 family)